MNKLEQLKSMTQVVAESGDLGVIVQNQPRDAVACDYLGVSIGLEILNIVPGRVSSEDAMATEKLAERIRLFTRDQEKLVSRLVA